MAYKLIKGEFHIFYPDIPRQGPEPDGDTLKFKPDQPALVEGLKRSGRAGPNFNARGMINLRLEGIDALETHFEEFHQNMAGAIAARDELLRSVGFGDVSFFDDLPFKARAVEHHPRRGFMLATTLDDNGRVVAFVYPGESEHTDGAEIFLDLALLDRSINAALLAQGLVDPLFYTTLPIDLMERLRELTVKARAEQQGLWGGARLDVGQPVTIPNLAELQELVIWPKLFRRLARYFATGNQTLAGFDAWLRADAANRDDKLILPNRELGNLHDLIAVSGNQLELVHRPEDVIILPSGVAAGSTGVVAPVSPTRHVRIVAALVNPAGAEAGNEVVTLLNLSPDSIPLTGWSLADGSNRRHQLQGALAGGAADQVRLKGQMRLGNAGGTITLLGPGDAQIDQVSYKARQVERDGWTITF